MQKNPENPGKWGRKKVQSTEEGKEMRREREGEEGKVKFVGLQELEGINEWK